jgi:hypothetical protein
MALWNSGSYGIRLGASIVLAHANSSARDVKLHYMLTPWDMPVSQFPWHTQRWRMSRRSNLRTSIGGGAIGGNEDFASQAIVDLDCRAYPSIRKRCMCVWCLMTCTSSLGFILCGALECLVLTLRVKTLGLLFIGCVLQWPWRRHCFESSNYVRGENLRSWIGRRRRLYSVSSMEASFVGELFLCFVCGCYEELTWPLCRVLFLFLFKFWLCVSLLSFGYFVDAESGCN